MSILITGGLGFIGKATARLLVEKGYDVKVIDNLDTQVHGRSSRIERTALMHGTEIVADITNRRKLTEAMHDVEYIYHLAALTGSSQSFIKPAKYSFVNSYGTSMLFDILANNLHLRRQVKKMIFASSSYVYGEGAYSCIKDGVVFPPSRSAKQLFDQNWETQCPICGDRVEPFPVDENKPLQTPNPYSLSKFYTEKLAELYSDFLNIPFVAFRYFNVFGPGQSLRNPYTGVMSVFISRIKNRKQPLLYEDGLTSRDFVYIDDVAKINVMALEKGRGIYNVGTGIRTTIKSVSESILNAMNSNIEPSIVNEARPGDTRAIYANSSRLEEDFGFSSFVEVKKGIDMLVNWSNDQTSIDRFDKVEEERKRLLSNSLNRNHF